MKQNTNIINECVRILYKRANVSNNTTVISSSALIYLFREQIALPLLLAWFCYMMTLVLTRYWLAYDYKQNKDKTIDHRKYENRYAFAVGFTGLGWAVFTAVALTLPLHEYHAYALLFLTAIVALSVPIFSSSMKAMYSYIGPSLIIIPLLLSQGGDDVALAIAMIVFSVIVLRIGRESNGTLISTLTLRHKTQVQAEKLEQVQHEKKELESRFSDIFKVAPEAIITFDSDLNIVLFNNVAEKIFGYQQSEVLGKNLHILLPEFLWQKHDKYVRDFDKAKINIVSMQERPRLVGTRKDGQTFPITASVSKVGTKSEKLYIVMIKDISERISAEKTLHLSQQRLLLHREQSPIGIIEWNPNFEIVDWNPAAEKIFGFTKDEALGAHITECILPQSARPIVDKVWDGLITNSGGSHAINENITKDKGVILCEWHNTSLVDVDGNVIGVTSLVNDITERHKVEESLRISQQRLLLHREQSPIGIIEWTTDFEVVDWNPAAEKIFGFTKDEVVGAHITERILHQNDDPAVKKVWKSLIENKNDIKSLNENITKDGRDILCEWHSTPLVDDDGNVIGVTSLVSDVTERHETEESLRISQQRLLLHREQSPVGILEWNTNFEVAAWNPAAERIFGYSKEEVMGKYILDMILPERAKPAVEKLWETLLGNKGGAYSVNENITKDGRTILCEWHNTPLVDDEGKVIGVSVLVEDITEKQKQEESERQMQKMDAIGKLTGGIAHDFNNMLGVILGFSGLLKKSLDGENPKQLKYCDQILKAGDRAKELTSSLLEFSSTAPASEEAIDINILLSDMKHMLETTLTPRIELTFELEEDLWLTYLDKARLEDAILNMSINAMHAMPDGGKLTLASSNQKAAKVTAHTSNVFQGDHIAISITDTGSGIDPEALKNIFDPFFTTKGTEGTGLGLSQVYGFVQQAGGTIDVSSEVGYGTTFTLYLPRCTENETAKVESGEINTLKFQQNNETILVVDDEPALLSLNEAILTSSGYNVLLANNAKEALDTLKTESVDLMLSDVIMPEVNGYQLAAEVEKLFPEVKIQMISGYSEEQNKSIANNKFYKHRLNKPIEAEALLHRIAERLDNTG